MPRTLTREQCIGFASEFRAARASALRDAEAFEDYLFALERLGSYLDESSRGLGWFLDEITKIADKSSLANDISLRCPSLHRPFNSIYWHVVEARNDALHQGAVARHLSRNAQELGLILEDALMSEARIVGDYMIREPLCAELWQPIGTIRRSMLMNAYSFLPCKVGDTWHFVSDYALAKFLRISTHQRKSRMLKTLDEAIRIAERPLDLGPKVEPILYDETIDALAQKADSKPWLVIGEQRQLVGILTAFDIL